MIKKTLAAAVLSLVALKKNGSMSVAGVQVMPVVGAVTTVDVRADGGRAAELRKRCVGAASGSGVSGTSLFVGDWRRPRRPACSVRLRQCRSRSKRGLGIVSNLGGQYEDGFEDVHVVIN